MNTKNVLRGAVFVSIALIVARCISCFDRLPARMMTHFDIVGRPNGFMPRASFFVVYGVVAAGSVLLVLLAQKLPVGLVNVPNRDYWLAPEHQAELRAKLAVFSTWLAAGLTLLLVWLLELVLEANLRQRPLGVVQLQVSLLIAGLGILLQIVWLVRAFRIPRTG